MLVYYSILIFLVYLGIVKKYVHKSTRNDKILMLIGALVLLFFAAFRNVEIGADTEQYVSHFLKISQTKFSDFSTYSNGWYGDIETGYKYYNKFLSFISTHPQTIIIANSILQMGLIAVVIAKESKDQWLSIFLYFTFCFYQTALNLTPSSFVSYFMFLSYPFIKKRKFIPFLIFVLVGMSFHTSAIFFLPLYFLYLIKINKKTIVMFLSAAIFGLGFYATILPVILRFIPEKYVSYIDGSRGISQITIELLVFGVQLLAILLCIFMMDKIERKDFMNENGIMYLSFLYETILYMMATQSAMFSRGAFLFSPYTIIIIPELISKVSDLKKRKILTTEIVVFGIAIYIARVLVNNVGTTMPYKFML